MAREWGTVNYNRLRYFYEVAKLRNITKAAAELYVSQPALSKQITSLEGELGTALFHRTNRNLILTGAGEHLFRECEVVFSREESIRHLMEEIAQEAGLRLRVACMGTDALYSMPAIIRRVEAVRPGLAVACERMDWGAAKRAVETGEVDAGILISYQEESSKNLRHAHILTTGYSVIAPEGHRFAKLPGVRMEMLRDEKFITVAKDEREFPYDPYGSFLTQCKRAGFSPRIEASLPNVEAVLMTVQAGAGIALLSSIAPTHHLPGLCLVPVEDLPPVYLDLVWSRTAENVNIGLFRGVVRDYFREKRDE